MLLLFLNKEKLLFGWKQNTGKFKVAGHDIRFALPSLFCTCNIKGALSDLFISYLSAFY